MLYILQYYNLIFVCSTYMVKLTWSPCCSARRRPRRSRRAARTLCSSSGSPIKDKLDMPVDLLIKQISFSSQYYIIIKVKKLATKLHIFWMDFIVVDLDWSWKRHRTGRRESSSLLNKKYELWWMVYGWRSQGNSLRTLFTRILVPSVSQFPPNSWGIACWVGVLRAALCLVTRARKLKY